MTRDTAERARELAQWVHEKLCCAQNLPWEEGDICDDCLESAEAELMPMLVQIQAEARLEEAKWWHENFPPDGMNVEGHSKAYIRIAALAQALQLEEREGTVEQRD